MAIKILKKNRTIIKVLNYIFAFITVVWLVAGAIFFYDSYRDKQLVFITKSTIDLYQSSDTVNGKKIGIINPSDRVKVLRVLYIDDKLIIHVYVNNRQTGWVLKTNDINLIK